MKRFFILSLTMILALTAWGDIDFGSEKVVSTEQTWVFGGLKIQDNAYNSITNTLTKSDETPLTTDYYLRGGSNRRFSVKSANTNVVFADGYNEVSSTAYLRNEGAQNNGAPEASTTAGSGSKCESSFAFNADVAGTIYAKVKYKSSSGANFRIYFCDGTNANYSEFTGNSSKTDDVLEEIAYTSTGKGSFFITSTSSGAWELYAVRFVPSSVEKENVSTVKTWTFNDISLIGTSTITYVGDALYLRASNNNIMSIKSLDTSISGQSINGTALNDIRKYLQLGNLYSPSSGTTPTASDGQIGALAFTTDVPGKVYVLANGTATDKELRIYNYTTSLSGILNNNDKSITTDTHEYSAAVSAGTVFVGSTDSGKGTKVYAIKFVPTHAVTVATSTGTDEYGTVAAGSTTVAEGATTTITAIPAEGYQVSNWAVSGEGASISPTGDNNSNTTTLTMGTADAIVTCTFALINYGAPTCTTPPQAASLTYTGSGQNLVTEPEGVTGGEVQYSTTSADANDYSPTIPQGTDAGNYSVWWKIVGDDQHTTTDATKIDVTIAKATPTITTPPTASSITEGQTLASSTLSGGEASVAGSFSWSNNTLTPSVSDSNTTNYEVIFTPNDATNYNTAITTVTLTVIAATDPTANSTGLTENPASFSSLTVEDVAVNNNSLFDTSTANTYKTNSSSLSRILVKGALFSYSKTGASFTLKDNCLEGSSTGAIITIPNLKENQIVTLKLAKSSSSDMTISCSSGGSLIGTDGTDNKVTIQTLKSSEAVDVMFLITGNNDLILTNTGSGFRLFSIEVFDTYTVIVRAGNETMGSASVTTTSMIGDNKYIKGDNVIVTATSETGYQFVNWTDDNNNNAVVSTENPYNITSLSANTALTANFATAGLALTTVGGNGTITLKKGEEKVTTAQVGDNISVLATPNNGYYLSALTWKRTDNEGEATDILSTKTFTMPEYPVTVTAIFTACIDFAEESTKPTITLNQTSFTYDGQAHVPTVSSVSLNETILTVDVDYKVSAESQTAVGNYNVTITGIGRYKGTATAEWAINSAGFSPTVSITGWTYGESAKTPYVEGNTSGGGVTYSYYTDSNLSVQTTTENSGAASDGAVPVNAGTYYVKATIAANGNYGEATVSTSFTIAKAAGSINYTTPSVDKTSTDGAFTNDLTKTGDGTVTYSSSDTNVATVSETTGKVTIVGAGNTNITATVADGTNYSYETKTATYTLTVTAPQEASVSTEKTWTFNTLTENTVYNTVTQIDNDYYLRALVSESDNPNRKFTVISGNQALSFIDGKGIETSKYIEANGQLNIDKGTAPAAGNTAGDATKAGLPSFAFNASVAGTTFAKIKYTGNASNSVRHRMYFANADGTTAVVNVSMVPTSDIDEVKMSSNAAGSFFITDLSGNGKYEIYAVRFVPATTIKVPTGLTGGTVTADKTTANTDEEVTLTVTPTDGYQLKEGTLKAYYISTNGAETEVPITNNKFTKPDYYVYVKAEFEKASPTVYNITVTQPTGGTVGVKVGDADVTTGSTTATAGQNVTLSNTPSGSYTFSSYSVTKTNGGDVVAITNDSFTMPAEAVTVTATFTESSKTDISGATVTLLKSSFICNGSEQAPSVTEVTLGETVLTQGTDYTVNTIEKQINVGTYTVIVTGKGNYTGEAKANWTIKRNLGESVTLDGTQKWATYYAAEDLEAPTGVTVYKVTGVSGTTVTVDAVNYIKANTGVLLYSESDVDAGNLIVGPGSGEDYASTLLGSVEAGTMSSGTNYVLYNNQFILAEDKTLPANHCYLQIPGVSGTRSLTIEHGDDNTTDIHTTRKDQAEMENDKYYTLSGQRVEKPTKKGLYIKNGRKVVVK